MNIAYRIQEVSKKFPDKKSVVLAKDKSFYTFREFEERSNQFANRFVKLGITPGMRTLLFVRPSLDFSVITFALFKIGALPVLIDPGMGPRNLLKCVKQVRPGALVSVGLVHWIRRFKKDYFKDIEVKISLNRVGGATHFLYEGLEDEAKEFCPQNVKPHDLGAILFTSGGTGIPKGVLYTHGILNAQTDALKEMFSLDETKVDLPGFPLFALFTLAMGMTSVIPEMNPAKPSQCDPKKMVKNILDHKVTFVAGSPAIWERVGNYCLKNNIRLPSVNHVVMFGAPVRASLHETFQKILPLGDTFTPYGATECLPVTLVSGSEILKDHLPFMLSGKGTCIGRSVPGVKIKIIKVSDIPEGEIQEVPLGEIGEIAVQGLQVTPGYFEMEEETKKAKIIHEGELWHRMGDLGWMDERGNVWFLGRKVHRVHSSEEVFYPLQVEAIFNQHPEVKKSALIKLMVLDKTYPAIVIERKDKKTRMTETFQNELLTLKNSQPFTKKIHSIFLHQSLPVDVRHNIKIDRTKLSFWAQDHFEKQSGDLWKRKRL
jgi:acyl-CoA synthetase (AMP-forming)/AMP-acid ligase II